jgi:hypothetical protein
MRGCAEEEQVLEEGKVRERYASDLEVVDSRGYRRITATANNQGPRLLARLA